VTAHTRIRFSTASLEKTATYCIGVQIPGAKYPSDKILNGKLHPITAHEGPEGEKKYSSTPSLTSVLDRVGGQGTARPLYPQERDPVPTVRF